jgi:uncharacterized damage-inducible protein DinB
MLGEMSETTVPPLAITPYWDSVQENLLEIVDLLPEDKLNWTPHADLWNSKGILIHVSDARDIWMSRDVQDGEPYPNIWTTARTKDDLKRELVRSYERMRRFLANQSQLDAAHHAEYNDQVRDYDGHWIAFHLLEHDIHHRAELMQRLALLGIEHPFDL